jgi:hypothetical protein
VLIVGRYQGIIENRSPDPLHFGPGFAN